MYLKKSFDCCNKIVQTIPKLLKLALNKEPPKYSTKWFDTVSDEVLSIEREYVRKQYCSSGNDYSAALEWERLLRRFDKVMSKRAWGDKTPTAPSYHREHGHNLYKPD